MGLGPGLQSLLPHSVHSALSLFVRTWAHAYNRLGQLGNAPLEHACCCCMVWLQVVVHGLPWSYDTPQLQDLMKAAGGVRECEVMRERETGRSKGWGCVLYDSPDAAQRAIQVRAEGLQPPYKHIHALIYTHTGSLHARTGVDRLIPFSITDTVICHAH